MKNTRATSHVATRKANAINGKRKLLNCMLSIYESMLTGKFDCPPEDLPQHMQTMQRQIFLKCSELLEAVSE